MLTGSSGYAGTVNKTNMAERTPKRTLSLPVCRCCNCSFLNNPIDLFGAKSEADFYWLYIRESYRFVNRELKHQTSVMSRTSTGSLKN